MYTSYFAKSGNKEGAIAICAKVPEFFKGRSYKALAPSWSIWKEWHDSIDVDKDKVYTVRFKNEILSNLDPQKVWDELGSDAILLCYESPEKFCHRHLVADWLSESLGVTINEVK